ncbi:MAG: hypothetical protein EPO32_07455 [Anaerolineae bacterium]|nr:MAG: hypothetical protein EPO32_07455 [Anaerolineae bacterium]
MNKQILRAGVVGLLALALVAAAPLARLTIENQSDKPVYLWLTSETHTYYLETAAGTTQVWTPEKDEYTYRMLACGANLYGEMDLTQVQRFVVPVCGSKASAEVNDSETDVARLIKLVRITVENATGARVILALHGPDGYVFSLEKGESKEYTIPRGDYTYTAYGCGTVFLGDLFATAQGKELVKCP